VPTFSVRGQAAGWIAALSGLQAKSIRRSVYTDRPLDRLLTVSANRPGHGSGSSRHDGRPSRGGGPTCHNPAGTR
jgi:hypothetical protein